MKLRCIVGDNEMFTKDKIYEAFDVAEIFGIGTLYSVKSDLNQEGKVPLDGGLWKFEIVKENKMKELTLQQAFECEVGTKFEVVYDNGYRADKQALLYEEFSGEKSLKWSDNNEDLSMSEFFFKAKYIPIVEEKEVSFMEAVKAFDEGRKVKSLYGDEQRTLSEYIYDGKEKIDFTDEDNQPLQAREILEYKWYIIS